MPRMPRKLALNWHKPKANKTGRWKKFYKGKRYYMTTSCRGKTDREGYEKSVREWERLKAFLDGMGPCPYNHMGRGRVLLPEDREATQLPQAEIVEVDGENGNRAEATPSEPTQPAKSDKRPTWVVAEGFDEYTHGHYRPNGEAPANPYRGETNVFKLATVFLDRRRLEAEAENRSLKQWSEDRTKLNDFLAWLRLNYPDTKNLDHIDPTILNHYRDRQWQAVNPVDSEEKPISRVTLKKRLATVRKWLEWLVDQNILAELPKDMSRYDRVQLPKEKVQFFNVQELRKLYKAATDPVKLFMLLGLNVGLTQKEIATLQHDMVDWDRSVLQRDRHKTGQLTKARLWPNTLRLLREQANSDTSGPLLVGQNGNPLIVERIGKGGGLVVNDTIRQAFNRTKKAAKLTECGLSFKHLRKTSANWIEKRDPSLTSLFLSHAEVSMKRAYVHQHFEELFVLTDQLHEHYGLKD